MHVTIQDISSVFHTRSTVVDLKVEGCVSARTCTHNSNTIDLERKQPSAEQAVQEPLSTEAMGCVVRNVRSKVKH